MAFYTDYNTLYLVREVELRQYSIDKLDKNILEAYKQNNELRQLLIECYSQKILLNDELNYLKTLLSELEAKTKGST